MASDVRRNVLVTSDKEPAEWYNASKKVSTTYGTNAAGEVYCYRVNSLGKLQCTNTYATATLYKTMVSDEDNKTTTKYTDKLGRVVMRRNDTNTDTYYVYNDLNQLSYVLPPPSSGTCHNHKMNKVEEMVSGIFNPAFCILRICNPFFVL